MVIAVLAVSLCACTTNNAGTDDETIAETETTETGLKYTANAKIFSYEKESTEGKIDYNFIIDGSNYLYEIFIENGIEKDELSLKMVNKDGLETIDSFSYKILLMGEEVVNTDDINVLMEASGETETNGIEYIKNNIFPLTIVENELYYDLHGDEIIGKDGDANVSIHNNVSQFSLRKIVELGHILGAKYTGYDAVVPINADKAAIAQNLYSLYVFYSDEKQENIKVTEEMIGDINTSAEGPISVNVEYKPGEIYEARINVTNKVDISDYWKTFYVSKDTSWEDFIQTNSTYFEANQQQPTGFITTTVGDVEFIAKKSTDSTYNYKMVVYDPSNITTTKVNFDIANSLMNIAKTSNDIYFVSMNAELKANISYVSSNGVSTDIELSDVAVVDYNSETVGGFGDVYVTYDGVNSEKVSYYIYDVAVKDTIFKISGALNSSGNSVIVPKNEDDSLDLTGLKIKVSKMDNTTELIDLTADMVKSFINQSNKTSYYIEYQSGSYTYYCDIDIDE